MVPICPLPDAPTGHVRRARRAAGGHVQSSTRQLGMSAVPAGLREGMRIPSEPGARSPGAGRQIRYGRMFR